MSISIKCIFPHYLPIFLTHLFLSYFSSFVLFKKCWVVRVLCKSISQSTSVMWKGNQYFLQFSVSFALCVCPPTPQKFKKYLCSQSCHLFLHNSWDLCHVLERYSLLHDYKSKHSLIVSSIIFMVWVFIFTLWIHVEFILVYEMS